MKRVLLNFGVVCVAILLSCTSSGRILHVDNRVSVPYTAVDYKLKRRILRSLIRNELITHEQQGTCLLNIMEIDEFYFIELWPDGRAADKMFCGKLRKPLLKPMRTFVNCSDQTNKTTGPVTPNDSLMR